MIKFKVIDTTTGKEVSVKKINRIAKENGLMEDDIDAFFISEDGQLALVDDCGNIAYFNTIDTKKLKIYPVLTGKYPDLEYFERIMLENVLERHPKAFKKGICPPQVELVAMFPQTWGDTAGGFSEPGMVAGQAFTTQITTVMKAHIFDTEEDYYGVFFDNRPAYLIDHAPEVFFKDLKEQRLRSKYEAKKVY